MPISEQLVEQTARHQVFLEGLKTGEAKKFAGFLKQMDASLRSRLSMDLTGFNRKRLERLLGSVESDLQKIYSAHGSQLSSSLREIAHYEAGFEARSIDKVVSGFETVIPTVGQISAAVLSTPLSVRGADGGKLLSAFTRDWSKADITRVTGAIRQGFFEGQTNAQILKTIRGTAANKFRDGILAINSRNASAVVRTAVQHAASVARQKTWEENDDLVKGVRWSSTLDGRTSTVCRSLDGKIFPINKGPRPPIHIQCRSGTVAVLDGRFDFLKKGATRSSMGGPVDADETYYSWLKKQPIAFQNKVLGPQRAKLLRDGGLSAERFAELNLGKTFKPLTLSEMKRLEPHAFEQAFPVVAPKKIVTPKKPPPAPVAPPPVPVAPPAPKDTFFEAKTTQDASDWIVGKGYVAKSDYGKMDLSAANEINRSLYEHMRDFPELAGKISFVGSAQSLNRLFHAARYDYYLAYTKKVYPHLTHDEARAVALRRNKKIKVSGEYAFAREPHSIEEFKGLDGVGFNEKWSTKKGLAKFQGSLDRDVDIRWHPPGTNSVKSVMDHELGHQLDFILRLEHRPDVDVIYKKWNKDETRLSRYAKTNKKEFIAEAWAEYRGTSKPREIAKELGELIEKIYKARRVN